MNIAKLLDPKNDYVFKRIFGHSGNEEITKNLLQSIIPDKIDKIELDSNPITEKDLLDDKVGILDIKARLNGGNVNCDIEMQVVDQKDIEKRILFYWSKMYIQTIEAGEDYEKLKRCIVILITDYDLETLMKIPEYTTKWKIREEKYPKLVLTNVLELYIISLNKAKNSTENQQEELYEWLKFINNPEEELGMENDEINKAKKVLEEISQDERERRLSELREKYRMDQHAIMLAGYDKGLKAGIEQTEEKIFKIATNLLTLGMPIEQIVEVTGLTQEKIIKLKMNNNSNNN